MKLDEVDEAEAAVCLAHITDSHLLNRVREHREDGVCVICALDGRQTWSQVVPLTRLSEVVEVVALDFYDDEGYLYRDEQVATERSTIEVVSALLKSAVEVDALERLARLVASRIVAPSVWYERPMGDSEDLLNYEWDMFEESVKHSSRLLLPPRPGQTPQSDPERNYAFIQSVLRLAKEESRLVRTLDRDTKLYRARSERDAHNFLVEAQQAPARLLGPAPRDRSSAGRMNAQGVSFFYVALDRATACAEVASHSPYDEAVVGEFTLQQPLRVLDLTTVPTPRSVFDETAQNARDLPLEALSVYQERITRPVILDHNHPVDYAPTQILTDAFRHMAGQPLDGIMYPSRVSEGGVNVVFFYGDRMWFESPLEESTRFEVFRRSTERGINSALFRIDPDTVRRFRVERQISVAKS